MPFANIFSHSAGCLLVLLMGFFAVQKLLTLIMAYLGFWGFFAFISFALEE